MFFNWCKPHHDKFAFIADVVYPDDKFITVVYDTAIIINGNSNFSNNLSPVKMAS